MNSVSVICFGVCGAIVLSVLRRNADLLSPARLFGFIWCFSIGLTELKFSALQHQWSAESWVLLVIGVGAFLIGIFVAYVLNFQRNLLPLEEMRNRLRNERVEEGRLFWLIIVSFVIYATAYYANYRVRGWLPVDVIGTAISRVDFNVSGLTLWLYTATFIIFFVMLYFLLARGDRWKKIILGLILSVTLGSFFLLLMRYPIIMAVVIGFTVLYYATHSIRLQTAVPLFLVVAGFFYWISSLRFTTVVSTYLYSVSKMKFPKEYAFLTEPYMYVVTNLENFARSVDKADYHTFGYFTLDFVTAIAGLKYWVLEYFRFSRTPYLISNYNTYTAFWWFYSDFGALGLALIPLCLGFGTGLLYYRMRSQPSMKNITAYGVAVFCMFISYFNFPFAFLWFVFNLLALYLVMRWTLVTHERRTEGLKWSSPGLA